MSNGLIIGEIVPGKSDESPPTFTVIVSDHEAERTPELRPCEHRRFLLDERWSTVLCCECKTHVSAFAALMRYAEWQQDLDRRVRAAEDAERSLYTARLRALRDHKATTPVRRTEIVKAISDSYRRKPRELRDLVHDVERENQALRVARRRKSGAKP